MLSAKITLSVGILDFIWSEILYKPIFNFIIFLYTVSPGPNLGWAIVVLAIFVRLLFLYFSIKGFRTDLILDSLAPQIRAIESNEDLASREKRIQLARLVKSRDIDVYAEIWGLLGQVGFMIVLYQVVQVGLKPSGFKDLYEFVPHPANIQSIFFGIDVLHSNMGLNAITAAVLFVEQLWEYATKKSLAYGRFSERWLPLLFPLFTFIILMVLPATKALFVLTSVIFSLILRIIISVALRSGSRTH